MANEKEKMLDEIERAWRELQEVLSRVPSERMEESSVVEDWSVKDIMGHVTTWEDNAMTVVQCFLRERDLNLLGWPDVDAFNERTSAAKKSVPLNSIVYDFDKTHDRIVEFVKGLSLEDVALPEMEKRIRIDSYDHYREHASHIQSWLQI